MKTIGIISDTHNKLPEEAIELFAKSDRIIHAGDICRPDILWQLECAAPLVAVLGNNDHADFGASVNPQASFVEEGVRFVITHESRHLKGALQSYADDGDGTVVAVHGHTHVPKIETGDNSPLYDYLVCPGAVNRSREALGRRTIAFVDVEDGRVLDIRIVDLNGNVIDSLKARKFRSFDELCESVNLPADFDYKQARFEYLMEKYGEGLQK